MICLIIILISNSRQKAGGQNALPHTKYDENRHLKPNVFAKSLSKIRAECIYFL